MFVDEKQLAVLQAITDRVASVGQLTKTEKVLEDLRNHPKWEETFAGPEGEAVLARLLNELGQECLVEQVDHKGVPHLKLTHDAIKIDDLNTTCLF